MTKYKKQGWSMTDPDTLQFGIVLQDDVWKYRQFRFNIEKIDRIDFEDFLDAIWDVPECWYEDVIDITDYTDDEIEDHIGTYGYTGNQHIKSRNAYIKDVYPDEWKQIIAECIFEQELLN